MVDQTTVGESSDQDQDAEQPTRRNFLLEGFTAILSFLLVAVPTTLGGLFFLDPLLRKKKTANGEASGTEGLIRLAVTADVIPDDGSPVAATVIQEYVDDAWNRFRNVPVGSIWLRRESAESPIVAFSSVCPHLGCSVNYRRSEGDFFCPCHTSAFSLDGTKKNEIPPRNMDVLEVVTMTDGEPDPSGNEIWVRYVNFKKGIAEQEAI